MVNPMARGPQPARSVRIDHEVDERLRKLASEQGVSVNALATRSLRRYAEWDAFADKFGFVDMPASIFYRMLDGLSEEQLQTLGRWAGGTLLKEYITFWFKEVRLDTLLEGCPRLIAKYGRLFEYEEHDERGQRTLVLSMPRAPRPPSSTSSCCAPPSRSSCASPSPSSAPRAKWSRASSPPASMRGKCARSPSGAARRRPRRARWPHDLDHRHAHAAPRPRAQQLDRRLRRA